MSYNTFIETILMTALLMKLPKMKKISDIQREKFLTQGRTIPKCVNHGCDNDCAFRNWGNWSFKSECSSCMTARKTNRFNLRDGKKYITRRGKETGVVIHKKDYCENHNGELGFICGWNRDNWIGFESGLDLDHLDGDHDNNIPENVKTYCKLCHGRKSIMEGDCSSHKGSARKFNDL